METEVKDNQMETEVKESDAPVEEKKRIGRPPGTSNMKAKTLTLELAEDLAETIASRMSFYEVARFHKVYMNSLQKWITESLFSSSEDRTPEQELLREAVLKKLFSDSIIRVALEIISRDQITTTRKTTTLLGLSRAEAKALERMGHDAFVENFDGYAVTLKVEESRTVSPPLASLIEKLLKLCETENKLKDSIHEMSKHLPFPDPGEDCPEV